MTDPSLPPLPPALAARFAPLGLLGAGSFGYIVRARDLASQQDVAIKLLKGAGKEETERLLREGKVASLLRGEHIVRVFEGNWDTDPDSGRMLMYLIMEYLPGVTLQQHAEQKGPLPVAEAVGFLLDVCEALAEAHGHAPPFVHRDLKPSNIFLKETPGAPPLTKVLDFGLVKADRYEEDGTQLQQLTKPKALAGTPAYMAPEQVIQGPISARTDIWALGVILFRLLAGQTPFAGPSLPQVLVSVVRAPPPSLSMLRPGLPPALEAVVLRCLQKSADRRYPHVAALAHELAPFAGGEPAGQLRRIEEYLGVLPRVGSRSAGVDAVATRFGRASGCAPSRSAGVDAVATRG